MNFSADVLAGVLGYALVLSIKITTLSSDRQEQPQSDVANASESIEDIMKETAHFENRSLPISAFNSKNISHF